MKTIFTALGDYVSWKIYFHDVPQSMTLSELWPKLDHFHFFEQFLADAKAGALPNYSFIEPRYFADAALPSDQHPPHDVTLGEQLIAAVYNAVRAGPGWAKTMLIITYDEHGGNYDHVAPPPAPPPSSTITLPFNFDRYGIRVPAVLVSPYIPPRTKFRATGELPFDHTSIIATLRERFPTTPKLTARDAAAPTLSAVLSLPGPTNNGPLTVTALPYVASPADVAAARAAPLNGHQQALLQLAAHLPGTTAVGDFETFISSFLTHLRAGAGGTDVSAIQDVASAVNFIKGRLGSLFSSF
jgi:phospholipase C